MVRNAGLKAPSALRPAGGDIPVPASPHWKSLGSVGFPESMHSLGELLATFSPSSDRLFLWVFQLSDHSL
jgi:hypothetical protein